MIHGLPVAAAGILVNDDGLTEGHLLEDKEKMMKLKSAKTVAVSSVAALLLLGATGANAQALIGLNWTTTASATPDPQNWTRIYGKPRPRTYGPAARPKWFFELEEVDIQNHVATVTA